MKPLLSRIKHNYLYRMVGNLYTHTKDIIRHANHIDFSGVKHDLFILHKY